MNGHQPLIEFRRAGYVTPAVYVTDGLVERNLDKVWTDPIWGSEFAHVRIDEHDHIEALDLRYAFGMIVYIEGLRGDARAKRLHDAFIAAGAKIVATDSSQNNWTHHG